MWELRTAVSSAQPQRDQGRHDEALALLDPVHAWFTEGFDRKELQEAAALLADLRGRVAG